MLFAFVWEATDEDIEMIVGHGDRRSICVSGT
jgi:hypothetical protein